MGNEKVRYDEAGKEHKKVVTGNPTLKKKSVGKRIKETFVTEDLGDITRYLLEDIIIPTVKDCISDAVSSAVDMALFGSPRKTKTLKSNSGFTSYSNFYNKGSQTQYNQKDTQKVSRTNVDIEHILFSDADYSRSGQAKQEAENVLFRLNDLLLEYQIASLSDLYDAIGVTSQYTDEKWGWKDLSKAGIKRVKEGYILVLPKPIPLD